MNKLLSLIALFSAAFSFSAEAQAQNADTVKTTTFKVTNLHCDGDMPTIKKRLLNQDGIDEVTFTERKSETSVFTVTYHSAANTQAGIEKAVESTPGCDDQTETPYRVKRERAKSKK